MQRLNQSRRVPADYQYVTSGQNHPMKTNLLLAAIVTAFCAGCQAPQLKQKAGTEFQPDGKATTYVSPEEYAKMTDEERNRLHASVGVSATVARWGSDATPAKDLTPRELEQAAKDPK